LFGQELFWLKGSFVEGRHPEPPQIKSLHPNTTYALQADVANNELAGSSDGTDNQKFTLQHPLVISQQVIVRELILPTEEEQEIIRTEEGLDAINVRTNELGETIEILVRWHAVDDFDDSGPQSRHYTIDERLGMIRFGDGKRGMIPPVGADNIIVNYTFGGGKKGNVPVNAISGLKSAVPFVNAVTNHLVADGGSETETMEDVLRRGPLLLKNRNRAVTPEDFEALARGASRKVARAKCLPNTDEDRNIVPGWVTVMIVPDSDEAKPQPSQQLIKVVREGLELYSANVVSSPGHIHVTGPDYTEVIVEATVVPASLEKAAAVETSLRAKLDRYIHPLTGGPDGTGWEFGRDICLSEIIALAEGVEDVDHVEKIVLRANGRAFEGDLPLDKYALPVSGEHRISLVLDGAQSISDPCRASKTDCAARQEFELVECTQPGGAKSEQMSEEVK
jgi:predicted phage baseplate assembly protein